MKFLLALICLSTLSAYAGENIHRPETKQKQEARVKKQGPTNDFSPYPYAIDDKLDHKEGMGKKEFNKRDRHPDR